MSTRYRRADDDEWERQKERRVTDPGSAVYPFTDPVSGRPCELVIPPGGSVFPAPGQPKTGVRHPDCPAVADLCMDLDAFWCNDCGWNGRISGAWAMDVIRAAREGASDG